VVLVWACATQTGLAQLSGDVTVVSDYRYRGVSLSQGNPEPQVNLGYDHPDGWYAGALVSGVRLEGISTEQLVAYAGYTAALRENVSWEGGVSGTRFRQASDYSYNEVYLGLTSDNCSARIYYSPSYFYQYARTIYGEVNVAFPLHDKVQLLAHIGVLHQLDGTALNTAIPSRFDYRLGINARIAEWNVQLALTGLQKKSSNYPQYEDLHARTLLLSASYPF